MIDILALSQAFEDMNADDRVELYAAVKKTYVELGDLVSHMESTLKMNLGAGVHQGRVKIAPKPKRYTWENKRLLVDVSKAISERVLLDRIAVGKLLAPTTAEVVSATTDWMGRITPILNPSFDGWKVGELLKLDVNPIRYKQEKVQELKVELK
jgi:hypothetical protein